MSLLNIGKLAVQYGPRAMAGVRSLLSDPVKSTGLVTGGILGGKATEETINSGILGNSNMIQEGMNFFSSPAINFLNDIRNTPSGSILTPDQGAIDAENKFNEELNKKITTATQDNQSNILITPEVEQPSGLLTTPEIDPLDFSNTTPMPDQSLLSDYILTAEEAPETEEGLLSESSNPYYSVLAEAVLDMNFNSGSGQQILNQINNMPGIKQSEIVDTGLDNFLSSKDKVTKEELDNYILENNISTKINDVVLGEDKGEGTVLQPINDDVTRSFLLDFANTLDGAMTVIENDEGEYYRFQDYLSSKDPALSEKYINDEFNDEEREQYFKEYLNDVHNLTVDQVTSKTEYDKYTLPGGQNYKEILISLPTNEKPYVPSHFAGQVPEGHNLIAHARFNEREINGKKTLFIEEIQSDLHQQGRKEGYGTELDMSPAVNEFNSYLETIKEKYPELANSDSYLGLQSDVRALSEANSIEIANGIKKDIPYYLNDLNDELEEAGHNEAKDGFELKSNNDFFGGVDNLVEKGVPDVPFKKNWHELTMKRLIKYAVDNGFEAISLTPGEIQKERYDLSKYIDKVEVLPSLKKSDFIALHTYDKENHKTIYNVKPENIDRYVGKELGEKILKDIEDSNNFNNFNLNEYLSQPQEDNSGVDFIKNNALVYNNTDLEIGGEGMIGFYDKMLPSFMNKYLKKYNSKIDNTEISVTSYVAPEQIKIDRVYESGENKYKIFKNERVNPRTGVEEQVYTILMSNRDDPWEPMASYRNMINAKATLSRYLDENKKDINVPFIEITPEMKEEIGKKGITLAKLNSGLLSVA